MLYIFVNSLYVITDFTLFRVFLQKPESCGYPKLSFALQTGWQIASSVLGGSNTKMIISLISAQIVTLLAYIFAICIKKNPPAVYVSGLSKIYITILVCCILHSFMLLEVFKICTSSLL